MKLIKVAFNGIGVDIIENDNSIIKRVVLYESREHTEGIGVGKEIFGYLRGNLKSLSFLIPYVDLSLLSEFRKVVLFEILNIPYGKTATYGEVAKRIGGVNFARAVGMALNKNPFPLIFPCHRVIARNGNGGFSAGIDIKLKLLDMERKNSMFI